MTECEGCESENIKIPVMRARERRLEIVWVGLDDVVCVSLLRPFWFDFKHYLRYKIDL